MPVAFPARRRWIAAGASGALSLLGLASCRKEADFHCEDVAGLPPADVNVRRTLAYVDKSLAPAKLCRDCTQYVLPPSGSGCGACKLFRGPVHPTGFCNAYAPKTG